MLQAVLFSAAVLLYIFLLDPLMILFSVQFEKNIKDAPSLKEIS